MNVCLDTNAYRRIHDGHVPAIDLLESADTACLPVIVLGELHAGFEIGSHRQRNLELLNRFLKEMDIRLAFVDRQIAERYGHLSAHLRRIGTPIPTNDIWVAATAMELGARLLTYDQHFSHIPGLMIVAP